MIYMFVITIELIQNDFFTAINEKIRTRILNDSKNKHNQFAARPHGVSLKNNLYNLYNCFIKR